MTADVYNNIAIFEKNFAANKEKLKEIHEAIYSYGIKARKELDNGRLDLASDYLFEQLNKRSQLANDVLTKAGAHHFKKEIDDFIAKQHAECIISNMEILKAAKQSEQIIKCFKYYIEAGLEAAEHLKVEDFKPGYHVDITYTDNIELVRSDSLVIDARD